MVDAFLGSAIWLLLMRIQIFLLSKFEFCNFSVYAKSTAAVSHNNYRIRQQQGAHLGINCIDRASKKRQKKRKKMTKSAKRILFVTNRGVASQAEEMPEWAGGCGGVVLKTEGLSLYQNGHTPVFKEIAYGMQEVLMATHIQ